ncbi:AraC family transcriptional regulator [Aquimarina sp. D1M17]|uniref:AraC family transcriptional regulator n=1 Tax=Aquimarina acroporae TaxID=2937283 RepID=UPI0020BE00D7|nr:AraC family transcriptional regulator [Aquimarina acroporae]MCK8522507.1 AraC family transcriptional regulator [Aquimarina acroporae]
MQLKKIESSFIQKRTAEGLEILSIKGQSHSFPLHFRNTFCISLIVSGTRLIKMKNREILIPSNHISIINPYEVHSSFFYPSAIDFHTLYVDTKRIAHHSKLQPFFHNDPIYDSHLNNVFLAIIKTAQSKNNIAFHKITNHFLDILVSLKKYHSTDSSNIFTSPWKNVQHYINQNLKNHINITDLAAIAGINKYNFAKQFKGKSGMSPMHYIIMRKIFEAKRKISASTHLSELAYDYNFTDIAHFSKHFKRFIGISPRKYQRGILQTPRLYK